MIKILTFLNQLDTADVHYTIEHNRQDSIMVIVRLPGELWEVEFFEDDKIEIEILKSDGVIRDDALIPELLWKIKE